MRKAKRGYNEVTGLYASRYYAKKEARSDEVVAKVDGGYKIMSYSEYTIWRKQK